jgi:hypothetical protein
VFAFLADSKRDLLFDDDRAVFANIEARLLVAYISNNVTFHKAIADVRDLQSGVRHEHSDIMLSIGHRRILLWLLTVTSRRAARLQRAASAPSRRVAFISVTSWQK